MAAPKSQTAFDPTRTPFTSPAPRFTYIDIPIHGKMKVNSDTLEVVPMQDSPYPGVPVRLPKELMAVQQRYVMTCGKPGPEQRGCDAAVNGGCPLLSQYGRTGPWSIIMEMDGHVKSAACYRVYCGIAGSGRPTSQVHYLMDGWNILTDRTTTPNNIRDGKSKERVVEIEVQNLAPFYDHLKTNGDAPVKKKMGRPRKVQVAD